MIERAGGIATAIASIGFIADQLRLSVNGAVAPPHPPTIVVQCRRLLQ
jgi:hypothetical protein